MERRGKAETLNVSPLERSEKDIVLPKRNSAGEAKFGCRSIYMQSEHKMQGANTKAEHILFRLKTSEEEE